MRAVDDRARERNDDGNGGSAEDRRRRRQWGWPTAILKMAAYRRQQGGTSDAWEAPPGHRPTRKRTAETQRRDGSIRPKGHPIPVRPGASTKRSTINRAASSAAPATCQGREPADTGQRPPWTEE